MLSLVLSCIKGPRLYHVYANALMQDAATVSKAYPSNALETAGDTVLRCVSVARNMCYMFSPFILMFILKPTNSSAWLLNTGLNVAAGVSLIVFVAYVTRGVGRSVNPVYKMFLKDLANPEKRIAALYDCDLCGLPLSFTGKATTVELPSVPEVTSFTGIFARVLGRPLIYPGSIGFIQSVTETFRNDGRKDLIEKRKGKRSKIVTHDGNTIDTIFVDKRDSASALGQTLVICCEGNAGFFELGIVGTPIKLGYSVVGWNTPGFAHSTGQPYPGQILNAAETVFQYGRHLGFQPANIIVYGWSIGGFPAAYLASQHSDIKGLVLDATFDHVLPLAERAMPALLTGVVKATIASHFNLCVADHASRYQGPITIIRRKDDEIIATTPGEVATNRANDLLLQILGARFPSLLDASVMEELRAFVEVPLTNAEKESIASSAEVQASLAELVARGPEFSSLLGEEMTTEQRKDLLKYLVSKILVDVDGGHNNPLSSQAFRAPWQIIYEPSFVNVEKTD